MSNDSIKEKFEELEKKIKEMEVVIRYLKKELRHKH